MPEPAERILYDVPIRRSRIFLLIMLASSLAILSAGTIFAEVIHHVSLDGDKILINSTLILRSDNFIDFWNLTLAIPEKANVIGVDDESGKVDYLLNNGTLALKTNQRKSKIHVVNISYSVSDWNKTQGINYIELDLFGFQNDTTYAEVSQKLPYVFVPGSQTEYLDNGTRAKKSGPMSISLAYGGTKESDHYFTNSDIDLDEIEKIYPVIEGVTGLKVPVKFGIAVVPEQEYEGEYKDWSAGTFNGLIIVKESSNKNDLVATAIHETVHGFNQFALGWDMTNVSWFDEGTATYITSAAYRILGEQQPEIFGSKKIWRNNTMIYTLEPKKTPRDLLNYYRSGQEFMQYWYPQSDYDREFGYAFSELFIRDYVKSQGNELQKVYLSLIQVNETVRDKDEANRIILDLMDTTLTPCNYSALSEVESCTKELNEMSFKIPNAGGKEIRQFVEEPQVPKIDGNFYGEYLLDMWKNLVENLRTIWDFVAGVFR